MAEKYLEDGAEEGPNLPLVPVRGVTAATAMRLYERYRIEFAPPSYTELKLCEIILALEGLAEDFIRAEASRRRERNPD